MRGYNLEEWILLILKKKNPQEKFPPYMPNLTKISQRVTGALPESTQAPEPHFFQESCVIMILRVTSAPPESTQAPETAFLTESYVIMILRE